MRKIYFADSASTDERLMQVADANGTAALMWPWLLAGLDDWGRSTANPRQLRAKLFPLNSAVTEDLVAEALQLFAKAGLVVLYEVDGRPFVAVPAEKWFRYQSHIHRSKRFSDQSRCPAPSSCAPRDSAETRGVPRDSAEKCASPSVSPSPSPSNKPSLPKSSRLSAPGDADWKERAEQILAGAERFRPEFERLAELLAEDNKTGTVSIRRVVRELYEPLARLADETNADAFRYGLEAAITAGAPNARYVAKAAGRYRANGNGKGNAPGATSRGPDLSDYEVNFLTEG